MSDLVQLILLCLTGGVASMVGALLITSLKSQSQKWTNVLTSFSAGVLLSVGVLDLLPESIEISGDVKSVSAMMMVGILFVFFLEKSGLWFHHHDGDHGHKPTIWGVFFGDIIHNFIDGMAIGTAFLVDPKIGLVTTFAVAWHELPKEMADFWVYTRSGLSSGRALALNLFSSLIAVVGGVSVYLLNTNVLINEGKLLALTAGMFIFVALSDLVPEIHEEIEKSKDKSKYLWLLMFVLGLGVGMISRAMEM
jgi:zinc and cadmium transporter